VGVVLRKQLYSKHLRQKNNNNNYHKNIFRARRYSEQFPL